MARRISQSEGLCLAPTQNKSQLNSGWTRRIRVETRQGRTIYVITFSNGRSSATVRGSFTRLPSTSVSMQAEARQIHYVRNRTQPRNKSHHQPRRARAA